MAGSRKNFKYTADDGTEYAVNLDESNAELEDTGFTDLTDQDAGIFGLPKNVSMRYINVVNAATNATRRIFIGNKSAARFLDGGILLLNLIVSATGTGALLPFRVTLAVGEIIKIFNPLDTGLLDGDQDI